MKPVTDIWVISGMPGQAFATKGDAEEAAQEEFPNNSRERNYARIHALTLWASAQGKLDLVRRLGRL